MNKLIMVCTLLLVLGIPFTTSASNDLTGLHVLMAETYNLNLIDYEVSQKYTDNEEKFIVLEVYCQDEFFNDLHLTWIMKKEKYNELREKV